MKESEMFKDFQCSNLDNSQYLEEQVISKNIKKNILLIGGGAHCKSIIDIIEQENKYSIAGIIDKKELVGKKVLGYKIIGCDDDLEELFNTYKYALVAVGQIRSNEPRVRLFNTLKKIGYKLPVIVSPLAYVSKHSFIDEGTVIMHQVLINADVKIGKNCIVNSKALIEHDTIIEDNCHISTACILNGTVYVKENSFIGSSAVVVQNTTVDGFVKARSLIS